MMFTTQDLSQVQQVSHKTPDDIPIQRMARSIHDELKALGHKASDTFEPHWLIRSIDRLIQNALPEVYQGLEGITTPLCNSKAQLELEALPHLESYVHQRIDGIRASIEGALSDPAILGGISGAMGLAEIRTLAFNATQSQLVSVEQVSISKIFDDEKSTLKAGRTS